jgi:hypothetical protein
MSGTQAVSERWTDNPITYDRRGKTSYGPGSPEHLDEFERVPPRAALEALLHRFGWLLFASARRRA